MTFCTNCGQQNDDASRVCTNCGTQLGSSSQTNQQNPYQTSGPSSYPPAGSAPYPPPPAGAPPTNPYGTPPPYGSQPYGDPYANQYGSQGYGNQPYSGMQPGGYAGGYQGGGGSLMAVGQKRDPVMTIVFTFLTCGIYGLWWMYTYATEVKNSLGRQDLNPGMDIVLGLITCGIWSTIAFWYKYPKLIMDMQQRVGLPPNDISTTTLILGIFFAPASIYIIQSELNKIWDAAGVR